MPAGGGRLTPPVPAIAILDTTTRIAHNPAMAIVTHRSRSAAVPRTARALLVAHLAAGALATLTGHALAQGQLLAACSRGNLDVCFKLLERPRLDAGRREAIQFHLAEVETLIVACTGGDQTACATVSEKYPDLPPDVRPKAPPAKPQ